MFKNSFGESGKRRAFIVSPHRNLLQRHLICYARRFAIYAYAYVIQKASKQALGVHEVLF